MKSILLINVTISTTVGILTFISRINTLARNTFLFQSFSFYEQMKFYAQLSWGWKKFYNLGALSGFYHLTLWLPTETTAEILSADVCFKFLILQLCMLTVWLQIRLHLTVWIQIRLLHSVSILFAIVTYKNTTADNKADDFSFEWQ